MVKLFRVNEIQHKAKNVTVFEDWTIKLTEMFLCKMVLQWNQNKTHYY